MKKIYWCPRCNMKIEDWPLEITQLFGVAINILDMLEGQELPVPQQVKMFRNVIDAAKPIITGRKS